MIRGAKGAMVAAHAPVQIEGVRAVPRSRITAGGAQEDADLGVALKGVARQFGCLERGPEGDVERRFQPDGLIQGDLELRWLLAQPLPCVGLFGKVFNRAPMPAMVESVPPRTKARTILAATPG